MARVAIDWLVLELTGNVALVGLDRHAAVRADPAARPVGRRHLGSRLGVGTCCCCTQSVGTRRLRRARRRSCSSASSRSGTCLSRRRHHRRSRWRSTCRRARRSSREMVGTHRLRNAISLNASIFHLGGLHRPGDQRRADRGDRIGLVDRDQRRHVGRSPSLALAFMRSRELVPSPRQTRQARVRSGRRCATSVGKPTILWPIVLLAFVADVRHEPAGAVHGIGRPRTARAPPATAVQLARGARRVRRGDAVVAASDPAAARDRGRLRSSTGS